MIARMDPVKIRQKLVEITDKIAEMEKDGEDLQLIYIEKRKQTVLNKWLEQAKETTR